MARKEVPAGVARRQVRGGAATPDADPVRQREVVDAFFAAARNGDFDALVAALDPDIVSRSDGGPGRPGASVVVHGARAVAERALNVRPALAVRATGARQRSGGGRRHPARAALCGHGLHRHRREDRRPHRPRASTTARSDGPRRLTDRGASCAPVVWQRPLCFGWRGSRSARDLSHSRPMGGPGLEPGTSCL